ncbi:MAG TPA: hypothetical protein VD771_05815 [Gemmatimonadaceae bacterium]|nr:hypothetical protein [Gemmatimonadaceae bacterium]
MRFATRLAGALALALAPISHATAQTPGKTLALDFSTTVIVQGSPDTGLITGHAIGTADKMRVDVKMAGSGGSVGMLSSQGTVSMIVTDSGKTITYLDSKNNQYLTVKPTEMIAQAQQMGGMKMDFSGTEASVDNLGAGPVILGHPTAHYRVGTGMTMKISAMGQEQTVKIGSTTDSYYATDLNADLNPFASLSGGDMANMFGTTNKEFATKMKAAQAKLPKGTPLRAISTSTLSAQGQTKVTNSKAEVTAIQWVPSDPKAFEIPATYTALKVPVLTGTKEGSIPPK